MSFEIKSLITVSLLFSFVGLAERSDKNAQMINLFSAKDSSYALEKAISDLKKAFISSTSEHKKDGIPVGELGGIDTKFNLNQL